MTLFSFAVPIPHLKEHETYKYITFALSFLLDNPQYEAYFRRKIDEGHLTYLDNSYNETQIPATPEHVIDLYHKYHPSAVVSPDSDEWTRPRTLEAWDLVREEVPLEHIMVVARTSSEVSWYLTLPGPVGVSYWWMDRMPTNELHRVHFLGLSNLERLKAIQPPTLDTSRIVKMALLGIKFEDWVGNAPEAELTYKRGEVAKASRFERAKAYFNQTLTDQQLDLVAHNILALKVAVNGVQPQGDKSVDSSSRPIQLGNEQLGDTRRTMDEATSIIPHSVGVEYGVSQTLGMPSSWPHTSTTDEAP